MKNLPLISAVIPTYNYGHFVTEAVESALKQTYAPLEIIVVDDGSTDDTRERLAPYFSRIRYIYQENRGLSAARNTGIKAARGEFVAFLDSDDIWHPLKTEVQVKYLIEHPAVDMLASTSVSEVNDDWLEMKFLDFRTTPISMPDLLMRSRFGSCSVIVRKMAFGSVGMFDIQLRSAEDREMWIRIASAYKVERMELPLWFYRPTPGSMSKNAMRMEENIRTALRKAISTTPELQTLSAAALRRKAWAYCDFECSIMYRESGQRAKAFARLLRSLLRHPINLGEERIPHARLKMLLSLMSRGG